MSELTRLNLPTLVPFPVTVTAIHCDEGCAIDRHQRLFSYRFYDLIPNSSDPSLPHVSVERAGLFESPVEGTLLSIAVKIGDSIPSSTFVVASITEPCAHTVQYGGLCALCGNNVGDDRDYSGYNYNDRASIPLTHDNTGLTVLLTEARRLEMRGVDRLTLSRKLILVVDLDQTVIHATVDPTVGEWQRDPSNPNYLAVRDVRTFVLEEEPILPMGWLGPKPPPLRCTYYVKLRPHLADFLHDALQKYEMHIYTMATRNYALAIANIIDPTGIYFGDRILSRDESGSLTHKNLKRLFPVDQSMVAIIDDRGDVWLWESNLLKVVPYDFFVGIGDINSSFLPKKNGQLTGPRNKRKDVARAVEIMESAAPEPTLAESLPSEPAPTSKSDESLNITRISDTKHGTDSDIVIDSDNVSDVGANTEAKDINGVDIDMDFKNEGGPKSQVGSDQVENPTPDSSSVSSATLDSNSMHDSGSTRPPNPTPSTSPSPVDRLLELGGGEDNQQLLVEQSRDRIHNLEMQQHDRPLAKLQHDLHKLHGDADPSSVTASASPQLDSDDLDSGDENLLSDDDRELDLLNVALTKIHTEYYAKYDAHEAAAAIKNRNSDLTHSASTKAATAKPDLCTIIPELKAECLTDIVLIFSGILPLGLNLDNADIVIWCRQFGVRVVNDIYPHVTHVVCRDPAPPSSHVSGNSAGGLTFKARVARRLLPNCKIVNPDWLFACLLRWAHVPEDEFLIEAEPNDWRVNDRDVQRYEADLQQQVKGQRVDLEQYDLVGANEEVDDFLADSQDSMNENDSSDSDSDPDSDSGSRKQGVADSNSDPFIHDLYNNRKRPRDQDDGDTEDSGSQERDLSLGLPENSRKRSKIEQNGIHASQNTLPMDELEQELLEGFDDLED